MHYFKKVKKKLLIITAMLVAVCIVGCIQKKSDEYVDLKEYLEITDIGGYEGMAVIINGEAMGVGFVDGDVCYLPYDVVRGEVDNNYYWDVNEKLLTYATSKKVYDAKVDANEYTEDGVVKSCNSKIVICVDDMAYISLEYTRLRLCQGGQGHGGCAHRKICQ